jgi:hypothetical protein
MVQPITFTAVLTQVWPATVVRVQPSFSRGWDGYRGVEAEATECDLSRMRPVRVPVRTHRRGQQRRQPGRHTLPGRYRRATYVCPRPICLDVICGLLIRSIVHVFVGAQPEPFYCCGSHAVILTLGSPRSRFPLLPLLASAGRGPTCRAAGPRPSPAARCSRRAPPCRPAPAWLAAPPTPAVKGSSGNPWPPFCGAPMNKAVWCHCRSSCSRPLRRVR